MALGFEAKLAPRKILGIFPRALNPDDVMNALREIQNEDFGIPDLAARAGIRPTPRPTVTVSVFAESDLMQIGFGGEAAIHFALHKDCLYADYVTTTIFGPGFHAMAIHFCERLAKKAGLALTVNDETDYFRTRDFDALKHACVEWFGLLVQGVSQNRQEQTEAHDHYLCWALDKYRLKDSLPGVITPGGFYRYDQLRLMAQNIEKAADDFFVLFPNPCRDALHYRNLAMNKLWCDFRFTADEADQALGNEIAGELEIAAQLDPALPFPKKAYHELCTLLGRREMDLANVAGDDRFPSVGFRKFTIRHEIGHWTIVMHGSTPYACDPSGGVKIEFPGICMEFSTLSFQMNEDAAPGAPLPSVKDFDSSDPKVQKDLQTYDFPDGDGVLQQYNDPDFPLFLNCALKGQDKENPRIYHVLIITTAANNMELIDWALTIVEQCQYAEHEFTRA